MYVWLHCLLLPCQIDSVAIEDFEENSNDGLLVVTVTSLGIDTSENAGYTVAVGQCDDGIVVGGAHVLSLAVSRWCSLVVLESPNPNVFRCRGSS